MGYVWHRPLKLQVGYFEMVGYGYWQRQAKMFCGLLDSWTVYRATGRKGQCIGAKQ